MVILKKYWRVILGCAIILVAFLYSPLLNKVSPEENHDLFETKIKEVSKDLKTSLSYFIKEIKSIPEKKYWKSYRNTEFIYHIYENDKLKYWSSNSMPIEEKPSDFFPRNGLIRLNNGWYLCQFYSNGSTIFSVSFLVKHKFPYQNDVLKNGLNPTLGLNFNGFIVDQEKGKWSIKDENEEFICSFVPKYENSASFSNTVIFFLGCLLGIALIISAIGAWMFQIIPKFWGIFILSIIIARILMLKYQIGNPWDGLSFFSPDVYASSIWLPSFGDLVINVMLFGVLVWYIQRMSWPYGDTLLARGISFLLIPGLLLFAKVITDVFRGIVEDSSIPMELEFLFTLNFFSFSCLAIMGVLLYYYFIISRLCIRALLKSGWQSSSLAVFWFFACILYFSYELLAGNQLFFVAIWPFVINTVIIYAEFKKKGVYTFGTSVLVLLIFSAFTALNLNEYNERKEHSERELFASQLATDKEQSTEIEYAFLAPQILADTTLQALLSQQNTQQVSVFKDFMETKYFKNFWERYEIDFFLFDPKNEPIVSYNTSKSNEYLGFISLLKDHGVRTDADSNMYYIDDNFNQFSYVIKQPIIAKDSTKGTLFCTLKSKRIPEGIGFPRILINKKAKVLNLVENYSMARYFSGKLVSTYGEYSYPVIENVFSDGDFPKTGFTVSNNTSHYFYRKSNKDFLILSTSKLSSLGLVSTFSYVFAFFGIIVLVPLVINRRKQGLKLQAMTFALKIQLILISIVIISLAAFSFGSGAFVRNQYDEYTSKLILQRMKSVETELKQKFGEEKELTRNEQKNYIEFMLQKLSKVYNTDINMYGLDGNLIASSRPKVYSIGLVGKQLNSEAFHHIYRFSPSDYVHKERLGDLLYSAVYAPFINQSGNTIGYINLQHFAQQNEFEKQFESFMVAIINVFVFLTALSILSAVFITNWILAPLRILKQRFSDVKLGSSNQLIRYEMNDEIGALVEDYNNKIIELEESAAQLAQTEREGAWREMAKQVAHEIKNPLTPMKLSLQHLQRVYDPNDPNSKQKIDKVANSIVEQIDALAHIANEFSNFAKMPLAHEESVDLKPIIESCVELFKDDKNIHFEINCIATELPLYADRSLLLRVFNNLFKNAQQATALDLECVIKINIVQLNKNWRIEVKDNGIGIKEDEKHRIFVPNFTTKSTGTGLGLAVVKQIIESHRGKIWFTSEENLGTTFYIELPIHVPD
jgi:two-component system, NtrC family, nitrogen regulation sensor histidine kinase NtrY